MKERKNIFFGVWLIVVLSAFVLLVVVVTNSSAVEEETPTAQPTVTVTATPEYGFSVDIPRSASDPLNPTLDYTQVLGGSGSDVASGVITLDTYYIYGTTTSQDCDFESNGTSDVFVAKVGMSGEVVGTYTVQTDTNDILLSAKPYSKISDAGKAGIALLYKSEDDDSTLFITKVSSDLAGEYTTSIKFDGTFTLCETIYSTDYLILYINVEENGELHSEVLYLTYDLLEVDRRVISLSGEHKIVTAYSMGTTEIMLVNIFEEDGTTVGILLYDKTTTQITLHRFDGERTATAMTPKTTGGFLIEYTYLDSGTEKFGVMSVSSGYAVEFFHIVSGGDYKSISVVENTQSSQTTGYYIFATKETSGGYETFTEYICVHGDLVYVDTSFLSNILPKNFHISTSGITVVGEVLSEGQTDIAVVSADTNGSVVASETYGGSGEEAYVYSIINRYGGLTIFAQTLSADGDVPHAFGKSDVLILEIGE